MRQEFEIYCFICLVLPVVLLFMEGGWCWTELVLFILAPVVLVPLPPEVDSHVMEECDPTLDSQFMLECCCCCCCWSTWKRMVQIDRKTSVASLLRSLWKCKSKIYWSWNECVDEHSVWKNCITMIAYFITVSMSRTHAHGTVDW